MGGGAVNFGTELEPESPGSAKVTRFLEAGDIQLSDCRALFFCSQIASLLDFPPPAPPAAPGLKLSPFPKMSSLFIFFNITIFRHGNAIGVSKGFWGFGGIFNSAFLAEFFMR